LRNGDREPPTTVACEAIHEIRTDPAKVILDHRHCRGMIIFIERIEHHAVRVVNMNHQTTLLDLNPRNQSQVQ